MLGPQPADILSMAEQMELQYPRFKPMVKHFKSPVNGVTSGFRDSAFSRNRELPIHRWVPWIAGFSSQFVDDCLAKYLNGGNPQTTWVLDPFSGVGTTLVESYIHGFNVVGFEINPYAVLASGAKIQGHKIEPKELRAQIDTFKRFMEKHCTIGNGAPRSHPPAGFSGRTELFSPAVERQVLFALD